MNRYERLNASIRGVVAAVAAGPVTNAELDQIRGNTDATDSAKLTGVLQRHVTILPSFMPTELFCVAAARRLMANLGWHPSSINALVYVTQTPGIQMPSGAHAIHEQLGLPPTCVPVQANYACAGYVYGLWLGALLGNGDGRLQRVLVLVGDTISQRCDPRDRATAPVFGDAASATALEVGALQPAMHFVLGTDPGGYGSLSMFDGQPIKMDGSAVFNFTLRRVPALIDDIRQYGGPDVWLFHQANAFMLNHLVRKASIPVSQVPTNLQLRGNTSCASIPLLMCDVGLQALTDRRVAMIGFGAGWTWGAVNLKLEDLRCAEAIEL
jgi:3-oxoacyl-[acyl-carrier-protein] synthase-3